MVHLLAVTNVLTFIIQVSVAVTLEQTIPEHNALVCPGELLSYTCTAIGDELSWQEDGGSWLSFNSSSPINTTAQGLAFTFVLVEVFPGSPNNFVSTATIPNITSNENNLLISCSDGKSALSRNVMVAAQPENCEGLVSCEVKPNIINENLSDVKITLSNVPFHAKCVVGYIFTFGNEFKYVAADSSPSATFTISKKEGLTFEKQEVFTINAENQTGEQSCSFGITKPNQITEISEQQSCEELTMTVTLNLEWNIPSIKLDNCLDASQIVWQYCLTLTNATSSQLYTTTDTFLVIEGLSLSSQYNVTIIPVLSDLGISGDPLTTNIVLNATCPLLKTNTGIVAIVVPTILAVIILSIAYTIFISCLFWYRKKGSTNALNGRFRYVRLKSNDDDGSGTEYAVIKEDTPMNIAEKGIHVVDTDELPKDLTENDEKEENNHPTESEKQASSTEDNLKANK